MSKNKKIEISRISYIASYLSIVFSLIVLIVIIGYLLLRNNSNPISNNHEIVRVNSPDSLFDAILTWYHSGGATGGTSYNIFIEKKGQPITDRDLVFSAEKIDSLSLSWREPNILNVRYKKAEIFKFKNNLWFDWDKQNYRPKHLIEIRLEPDSTWSF